MRRKGITGWQVVFLLLLRQYWKRILVWLLGLTMASVGAGLAYADIYADPIDIRGYALTMENPAMKALVGTGYAVEDYHLGAIFANQLLLFSGIAVAVMNISIMLKSTRADEEEGRLELLLSLPIGRFAIILPSVLLLVAANTMLTVVLGTTLSVVQIDNMPLESCFLYSTLLGAIGLFFAGLTLLSAQLVQTSRAAAQLAYGSLLFSYLTRAVGDMRGNALVRLSPLGLLGQASVFVDDQIWPTMVLLLGAGLLFGGALYVSRRRDMGAGLLPERKGREEASWTMRSPAMLFWRLERNQILMWTIGIGVLGIAFAAILGDLEAYFSDLEIMQAILPEEAQADFTREMISLVLTIFSLISAIPVITASHRLRKEEESGRLEVLLSRPASRVKLFFSTFVQSGLAAVLTQTALAASFYYGARGAGLENFLPEEVWIACYAFLPALLFTSGMTLFFTGLRPSFSYLSWVYLLFSFLITYLGGLLEFPEWLKRGASFYAVPHMPFREADWSGPLAYAAGTMMLLAGGAFLYNRRDMLK